MKRKFFVTGGVIALTAAIVLSGCQQAVPQKPPEQVVKEGMAKLTTVTSHEFELGVKGDLTGPKGEKPEKVKFDVTLGGSVDLKDNQDPKINLKLDGSGNADEQTAAGSAELRMTKEALYFTLAKIDMKGGEQIPKEFMDAYVGKWWKVTIPPESLKEFTASLPEGGTQENMTPEQKKMKQMFENTQFFKNIKFVGLEDVKGEQSAHYSADLDKDAFMTFVQAAAVEQGNPMTESDIKDMKDGMQKFDFTGNVWVGQSSGIMNQVSGDVKLSGTAATDPSGTVSIRITLWNFNKPVTVQAPADAKEFPINELLGGMMGPGAGSSLDSSSLDGSSGTYPTGTMPTNDGTTPPPTDGSVINY